MAKLKRSNEIAYQKGIISFIDVLGFRALLLRERPKAILDYLELLHWTADVADDEKGEKRTPDVHVVAFSDSIIRVANPLEESALFHELLMIIHAQMELSAHGVFLRGGLTYGDVYAVGNTVFGPGFVEAYELESKYAVVPRVVISHSILHALQSELLVQSQDTLEEEIEYIKGLLQCGDDGVWWVDYLRAAHGEMDEPDCYPEYLLKHKQGILSQNGEVSALGTLSAAAHKMSWLATYHNQVVSEIDDSYLEERGADRSTLIISETELPALVVL